MIKEYYRPQTVREAVKLKSSIKDSCYLAGGVGVNRKDGIGECKSVIDISAVVSSGIIVEGSDIVIESGTRLQELAESPVVPAALKNAAGSVFSRNIRNQATVGGNIGENRPDSSLIPVLVALDASLGTSDGDVPLEEYLNENLDYLVLQITVPAPMGACRYVREARSSAARPVVSAAVSITVDKGLPNFGLSGACVAVGCVADRVIRLKSVEEDIVSGKLESVEDLEKSIHENLDPVSDYLGSAEYKRYINSVLIARSVVECLEELL
jgi:putative selenate reductase FAD-binding subunit